jgi:hypothetical protein
MTQLSKEIKMYALIRNLSKFFKMGMYDYCNLESVDDEPSKTVLVTKDGGLCSFIEIRGGFTIIGDNRFSEQLELFVSKLSGALSKQGFRLQFVFSRDPENSYRPIVGSLSSVRRTIKNLELDIMDMIDEREKVLSEKTSAERCFLVITTLPTVLPPSGVNEAIKDRVEKVKDLKIGIKPGEFAQSPFFAIQAIRETHSGIVSSITNALREVCQLDLLTVHEAVRSLKMEINSPMTSDTWKPSLLGDKISPRLIKESGNARDVSHIMNPDISFQLFNQQPSIAEEDKTLVKIGDTYSAPLMVDIPPQDPQNFMELFKNIPDDIPWRWSFTIETGHNKVLGKIGNKHTFASFLAFTSGRNKLIKAAAEELMNMANGGETLVMCYMSLCTWAEDYKQARRRKQILAQAIQNWGHIDVIDESGDAIEAWANTLPGMSAHPISNSFPMPLIDAMSMTPFLRPASPWKNGSVLFRTIDNKIFPFWPGSSLQTSWTDLVFAPPGFGKSFYLSASNMGLITAPGNTALPRIAIIDIGFSSAAFVNMVQSALPAHKKYLAQSFKMEMTRNFAINPFDTPLGCRRPLSVDREFLINFLSLVLTPAGSRDSILRLSELVGSLIDSMYLYFDDNNNPNPYEKGVDTKVDKTIEEYNIRISNEATWWNVVDALFEAGLYVDASLAQRYAVPTLNDATSVLTNDHSIRDIFGDAKYQGESIINFVNSMIVSATKDYVILSQPSAFDIGNARIVSMDLSSVAKSGSDQADKKTGVMYMLARQVLCREFYRNETDTLPEIPVKYRHYHAKKIEEDSTVPKKICMDEFHRTKNCQPVRNQSVVDIREGRKFNVHIALLSQMIDDFDDAMIELATNVYILSKGIAEDTVEKIKTKFSPSEDAIKALRMHVTGPTKEGSSMLYMGALRGGTGVEHIIRLTLGAVEVWAYSTTHEDVKLRKKLTDDVGLNNALRILSSEFPGGTAKDYIQSRNLIGADVNDENNNIFDIIKGELIIKHKELISI